MVSFPPSVTKYTKPTTVPRLMHNGPNDIFLPQAQHEAQSLLHLSVQRELHHHQGQPAPLPGLSSQALHRHRHDERVWVDFGCICPPGCSQAVVTWAHVPCLHFGFVFFTTVFYFCLQSLLQKKKRKENRPFPTLCSHVLCSNEGKFLQIKNSQDTWSWQLEEKSSHLNLKPQKCSLFLGFLFSDLKM